MINEEMERMQVHHGKMTEPEKVTDEDNVLNVAFTETDQIGNVMENGTSKDNSLLVKYFNEPFRKIWMGKKKDDFVILQLSAAFDEKERDWVISILDLHKEIQGSGRKIF